MENDRLTDGLLETADCAYSEGRMEETFQIYVSLVGNEDPSIFQALGEMTLRGEGVEQNTEKGLEYMKRAVELGNANAAFNLGALHRSGDCGVTVDLNTSKKYFLIARDLGCELNIEEFID